MPFSGLPTILTTEDDDGHALLIQMNLEEVGVRSPILRFSDGQELIDFLSERKGITGDRFLILLDIRIPKLDGVQVLRLLKSKPEWASIPVMMLTTTDDNREMEHCYALGCNVYIQKPVDYERFAAAIHQLGRFVSILLIPQLAEA